LKPQIALRYGRPVVIVTAFEPDAPLNLDSSTMTALDAFRGGFDFAALLNDSWLQRDHRTEERDVDGDGELPEPR
jgi:hypothetical protein